MEERRRMKGKKESGSEERVPFLKEAQEGMKDARVARRFPSLLSWLPLLTRHPYSVPLFRSIAHDTAVTRDHTLVMYSLFTAVSRAMQTSFADASVVISRDFALFD